ITSMRIRPSALGAPPSRPAPMPPSAAAPPSAAGPPSTGAAYSATAPASTSGTYPAAAPPSTSGAFIPTAQTLPLSAVMQLQEQLQEHLKAQAARGRGGGTLALPTNSPYQPGDPLKSTASSTLGDAPPQTARSSAIPTQVQPPPSPTLSPII